jgi:hypothetical protein
MRVPVDRVSWADAPLPTVERKIAEPLATVPPELNEAVARAVARVRVGEGDSSGLEDLPATTVIAPERVASSFTPDSPATWEEAGIEPSVAEGIALRLLLGAGRASGRKIAGELCLPLRLVQDVMNRLKSTKLVVHVGTDALGDFVSELSDGGRERALMSRQVTTWVGSAPVPWAQYLAAVGAQGLARRQVRMPDLQRAFADLSLSEDLCDRLGPAIAAARPLFLFGEPGNGKTSIAERITRCYGDDVWIPHVLDIEGHLVKLYDPAIHELSADQGKGADKRWVRIKRPTVVAGGELTLDMLDLGFDPATHVGEAPLQLKASCGTFLVDDFGRGKTSPKELLNRWIFPLEKGIDFLALPDGRKVDVPFTCMLVLSTNLEPRDLADEAFFRRIPYKVHVGDPHEDEFIALLELLAGKMGVALPRGSAKYLVERHYKLPKRAMRFCHPRDLLLQVDHLCRYTGAPLSAGPPEWDRVVANYFGLA